MKVKKSATKAELILHLESLQQKYDANTTKYDENTMNIDFIKALREKNSMMVKTSDRLIQETQTENEIILCHKCDYEADDRYELY